MSPLEILASLFTLASVLLTVHLKKSLYPVGLVATVLFFFVFWQSKLYASAGLQVYFTLVQLYGWWFWTRGDRGREPPIGEWPWTIVAGWAMAAAGLTAAISFVLYRYTDAHMPAGDTAILALSILAQFLLDRKQLKSWYVWAAVDVLSVYVYASQHLWPTTVLFVILTLNTGYGWWMWRRELARQAAS